MSFNINSFFLQLNPREYHFLNLVRFIQNNSYCNNLTLISMFRFMKIKSHSNISRHLFDNKIDVMN